VDEGTRKYGLAALIVGGAVAAGQWYVAVGVFVVYTAANVYLKLKDKVPEPAE